MIKPENYISVQGWMILDPEAGGLGLKGNDLLIYAIIYGFAQTEGQCFCGSLSYLQEWTRSTRAGVIKNINNLIAMGLIRKVESTPTNRYYIVYRKQIKDQNKVEDDVNNVEDYVNKVEGDSQLSIHNNIINTNINKYNKDKELTQTIENIISLLNTKCNTKFKSTSSGTRKLIKARLKEGFTLEDFKQVIECKYQDWGENPTKFKNGQWSSEYLRPQTLFGEKFESYVHEAKARLIVDNTVGGSISAPIDEDVSDFIF